MYEVTGERIKQLCEEHNDLYCAHRIVWLKKSKNMRWMRYVARMWEIKNPGVEGIVSMKLDHKEL
jgi:hypothetical protein